MAPALQDRPDVAVFSEIGVIEHLMRNAVCKHLPAGMTYAHFELLMLLIRAGDGQTPVELAEAMLMSKGAMTNVLQKMSAQGLVVVLADVSDRRKKRVRLTKAGSDAYVDILKDMKWKMDALRDGFTDREFSQALPFLKALRTFLEEISRSSEHAAANRY